VIVVDTNVIAYLWLRGAHTAHAEALLRRDPDWAAPLLWRSEFRNVLAGFLRRGELDPDAAAQIVAGAEDHLRGREFTPPALTVLELVQRSRCSAYDCEFIAVASDLGVRLVTSDKKILADFPKLSVALETAARR